MSSKGATVSVLYPRKPNSTFNLDYYLSTHMPLVAKTWTKNGLKTWSVTQLGEDAPYSILAVMEWDSLESFGKAAQDAGSKEIMDDVDNFSSEKPIIVHGNVVGRS